MLHSTDTFDVEPESFEAAREVLKVLRAVVVLVRVELDGERVRLRRDVLHTRHDGAAVAVLLLLGAETRFVEID